MSGKKLLLVIGVLIFLFTGEAVRTQETPEESMLIPVSLRVEQVEPFLTVGESVRGFKLQQKPSGLGLALANRGFLDLWVSNDIAPSRSKPPLSHWKLKPFWDSQGLTLLATEGHNAVRKVYTRRSASANPGFFTTAVRLSERQGFKEPFLLLASKSGILVVTLSGRAYGSSAAAALEVKAMIPLRVGGGQTALLLAGSRRGARGSGFFLYIGRKHAGSRNPAEANGLNEGRLLALKLAGNKTENALKKKGAVFDFTFTEKLDEGTLFADASGLCVDPGESGKVFAVTRGSDAKSANGGWINHNGRLYSLSFKESSPEKGGKLRVLLQGTEGILGPSCVAADSKGAVLIGEAPRFPLPGRDSSIWKYQTGKGTLERLLEIRPSAGSKSERGEWRVRALLDASAELGPDWWLGAVTEGAFDKGETGTKGQLVALGLR